MRKLFAAFLLTLGAVYAQPSCAPVNVRCVGSGQEYATIQAAATPAVAGDLVYVFAGNYTGFQVIAGHVSGTSGNLIRFQAQNSSTIINVAGNGSGDGINIDSVDYVSIDGFTITGMGRTGVRIVLSTGSVVKNCNITASQQFGVLTGFAPRVQILSNTISGSVVQHGIYVSNSSIGFDGPIIKYNVVHDNQINGIQLNGDCSTLDPSGNTDGVISGAFIEGNTLYNNLGRGLKNINVSGSTIRNNLIYNNGQASEMDFADQGCGLGSNNNVIVNNTMYSSAVSGTGIRIISGTGNTFYNNLIVANAFKCVIDATAAPCDNGGSGNTNNFYQVGLELNVAGAASGVFTNVGGFDFTLASGSPALNIGLGTYRSYTAPAIDLLDNLRPVASLWDVGCYERSGTPAPADTTPPTTPGTPGAVVSAYSASLTWTASADALEVIGYIVYRNSVPYASALLPNYVDTAVVPGTTYSYVVYAYDSSNNISSASGAASVTVYGQIGCMNADAVSFRNVLVPVQTGSFQFEWDSKPFGTPQSVIALSAASPTVFSDLAVIVAFQSSGVIQARNGSTYSADIVLNWNPAVSYHFRTLVNISAHTSSVFVTPSSGGGELTLATGYAFRTEQATATSLGFLSTNDSSGSTSVCTPLLNGFSIAGIPYLSVSTQPLATQVISTALRDGNGSGRPLLELPAAPSLTGSRPLTISDNGALLTYSGSSPITVTVPTGLGAGFGCTVVQQSTGTITVAGSGLALVSRTSATHTAGTGSPAVIQCTGANVCNLWGDVQ